MALVFYQRRLAAITGPERAWLMPHVDVLEPDHPVKRFVCAMCLYAREVALGPRRDQFDQGCAEAYARCLLIPGAELFQLAASGWCDCCIAERLVVPLEQVRLRRAEVGAPQRA